MAYSPLQAVFGHNVCRSACAYSYSLCAFGSSREGTTAPLIALCLRRGVPDGGTVPGC